MAKKQDKPVTPRPVGRPRHFATPEEMELAIDAYLLTDDSPTVAGLCLYLGFHSRSSLYTYEEYGEEFSRALKRARLRMEEIYERMLKSPQCAGPIFALKNLGWRDNQDLTITALPPIQVTLNCDGPAPVPPTIQP